MNLYFQGMWCVHAWKLHVKYDVPFQRILWRESSYGLGQWENVELVRVDGEATLTSNNSSADWFPHESYLCIEVNFLQKRIVGWPQLCLFDELLDWVGHWASSTTPQLKSTWIVHLRLGELLQKKLIFGYPNYVYLKLKFKLV